MPRELSQLQVRGLLSYFLNFFLFRERQLIPLQQTCPSPRDQKLVSSVQQPMSERVASKVDVMCANDGICRSVTHQD